MRRAQVASLVALLWTYLRPLRRVMALLAALLLAGTGLQIAGPQVLRRFIDAATNAAGGPLRELALLFIALALAQQVVTVLATWLSEYIGWTATNALRADLARHCLNLDLGFHKERTPGEMIERIDGDVTAVAAFFSQLVIQLLSNLLLAFGVLTVLWHTDMAIGVALSMSTTVIVATMIRLQHGVIPRWAAARQASAVLFGFVEERLAGTEDLRSSGAGRHTLGHLHDLLRTRLARARAARLRGLLVFGVPLVFFAAGNAVALLIAALRHHAGAMTLGTAFAVYYYTLLLFQPLIQIANQVQEFQQATAGLGRIRDLLATRSTIADPSAGAAAALPLGPLTVEFIGVSFSYDPGADTGGAGRASDAPIIRDLTFQIAAGETLGLLGRTGSGKTTITRLLFRLYDPAVGAIRLGGIDLRILRRADLRRRVALVTQDVQLFGASVRDNLTFFDPTIHDERVWAALDDVGLASWARALPDGLDTILAPGGGGLSAGEAQLLAFGRAFLRDPSLVILDEASSRLDPTTEALIEQATGRLLRGRTAIVIAHRLATLAHVDTVLILEDGQIRELGPRARLAADPCSHFGALLRIGEEPGRQGGKSRVQGGDKHAATGGEG